MRQVGFPIPDQQPQIESQLKPFSQFAGNRTQAVKLVDSVHFSGRSDKSNQSSNKAESVAFLLQRIGNWLSRIWEGIKSFLSFKWLFGEKNETHQADLQITEQIVKLPVTDTKVDEESTPDPPKKDENTSRSRSTHRLGPFGPCVTEPGISSAKSLEEEKNSYATEIEATESIIAPSPSNNPNRVSDEEALKRAEESGHKEGGKTVFYGEKITEIEHASEIRGAFPDTFAITREVTPKGETILRLYDRGFMKELGQVASLSGDKKTRFFQTVFDKIADYRGYSNKSIRGILTDFEALVDEPEASLAGKINALSKKYVPTIEDDITQFLHKHPDVTPRSIMEKTITNGNKKGAGGFKEFYPIQQSGLEDYGLLISGWFRSSYKIPENPEYRAIDTPLKHLANVGYIAGELGNSTIVKIVPGKPIGSYLDGVSGSSLEGSYVLSSYGDYAKLSPQERYEKIKKYFTASKEQLEEMGYYGRPDYETIKDFQQAYTKQIKRISKLDQSVFDRAIETMKEIKKCGYGFDLNHTQNIFLDGHGKDASFGFIDLAGPGDPQDLKPATIDGFASVVLGMGYQYPGYHWLVIEDDCREALKQAFPIIIEKLEEAAQKQGIDWDSSSLKQQIYQRGTIPELADIFSLH